MCRGRSKRSGMDGHTYGVYGVPDVSALRHFKRCTAVQRSWIVAGSSLSSAQEGPSARHVLREIFDTAALSPTTTYDSADRGRVNRRCRLDSVMYDVSSGCVVCRASTVQTRDWSSAARTGHGTTCTDCFPTHGAGPAGCGRRRGV